MIKILKTLSLSLYLCIYSGCILEETKELNETLANKKQHIKNNNENKNSALEEQNSNKTNNKNNNNTNTNTESNNSDEINKSFIQNLRHKDQYINRAYKESFTMLGAYLLEYQKFLNEGKDAEAEFNKIKLFDMINGEYYFSTKINNQMIGDLELIDNKIKHAKIRKIWNNWCQHPNNYISWLLHPIMWIEANNIEELCQKTSNFNYKNRNAMIMWGDDGFWIMSKLLGIKIKMSPQENTMWQPNYEKWLIKIENDIPITR